MRRRSLLLVLGTSAVAGCTTTPSRQAEATPDETPTDSQGTAISDETRKPNIRVEDVVLAPGESAVFDIQIEEIASFSFDGDLYECGQRDDSVQFGDVSIDPDPDR